MSINWDEIKNYKPKRNFMFYFRKFIGRLSEAKYWLRCHTFNKYHLIDIRNNEYKWGWVDADHQLLYACFGILKTYIEKELNPSPYHGLFLKTPEGELESDWVERVKTDTEVKELYDWWTIHRPNVHKSFEDSPYSYATAALYQKDTEMLKRLMDVRETLWT